ncbi:MAG: 3-oxoacyl-[acyl-carrier-protein] synthase III C-terminal domain-containing protein [Pseudomonadota bacterium]|nr:3-oxoacyl-[acyl-carrier-protein] synthase III C-terminal domain-containing protein [Pseudomonadota bacterium]
MSPSACTIPLLLGAFSARRPGQELGQAHALEWLAEAHARSEASLARLDGSARATFEQSIRRRIGRFGCQASQVASRGFSVADIGSDRWDEMEIYDIPNHSYGRGAAVRSAYFSNVVAEYFELTYPPDAAPPSDIIHVTCTGYVSPDGAQRLLEKRGWGPLTHVTHAYHMGCYAAFPAVRMAAGFLHSPPWLRARAEDRRVDIVHTELCSLHLDPSDHSPEQLVIQSLFADGLIRYEARATPDDGQPGLRVLTLAEAVLAGTADSMRWAVADYGMRMALGRDVPDRIAGAIRPFVADLRARGGQRESSLAETVFAIHPGGPKIIDRVAEVLELAEEQVAASRGVLRDFGNMSSATLPHVWMRLLEDPTVAPGTPIISLAFGPGLTVCGGVFRKQ